MFSLHLLHGFLGKPDDWASVFLNSGLSCYFEDITAYKVQPFAQFAKEFNKKISSTIQEGKKKVLVGYSMGGRLALYALAEMKSSGKPLFDAAILISAHPGLKSSEEKIGRLKSDELWAGKFENDPWDKLTHDWSSQPVFQESTFHFKRKEDDYNRSELADQLKVWSLGRQMSFTAALQEFDIPILWMAGEKDEKYAAIAKEILLKHSLSAICIMPKAGHRLPWEQRDCFIARAKEFLNSFDKAKT